MKSGSYVWVALGLAAFASAGCEEEFAVARGDALLVVDPPEIDFGDAAVGVAYPAEMELKNTGSVPLDITGWTLSDGLTGEFELTGVPDALGAGAREMATLTFAPTSPGVREGVITFETDSPKEPIVEVKVRGRGVEPAIVANPPSIDFGRVLLGRTETATVVLTNTADRNVTVLRASNDGTPEISASLLRTDLAPGDTIELVVSYAPADVGPDQTIITILDNSPRAEALGVMVRGEGVDTDVVVEPLALSFSSLFVGETRTLPFFIRNIGTEPHQVTELVFVSSNTQSTVELALDPMTTPNVPFTLAGGASQQIDVVYTPVDDTDDVDQVRIQATGAPNPIQVMINGTADVMPTPRIDVQPAMLDFGQVEVAQNRALNLTIGNLGTADLAMTADVSIEPAGTPYTLMNAPAASDVFRPMDTTTFAVSFAPTAVGIAPAAEVVIRSDDPSTPVVRVPLSGEGTMMAVPAIYVDPNPLVFGAVPRGTRASRSVLIRNDGTAPLVLNLVRLSNNAGMRFTLPSPPASPTTLAPTQSTTFNVEYFDSGIVATYNGALEITSNDPGGTVVVPITASTDPPPPAMTDISVTLTWSSTVSDMDLHLIRPGGSFFDRPDDCCFCNTNPDWGMSGVPQDNPFLDRDDLFGPGPETINLSVAENGEHQVVVHHYNDRGNGPVTVTVEVSIRGTVVATRTETLDASERWIAGRITWNTATQMGTWTPSILNPFFTILIACF